MLAAPCYIVSDLHLGVGSPAIERSFLAFLRSLPGRARSLVINGDLFDFWFEWKTVIPRPHFRTLGALADLRDAGLEIVLLAGNHDCWGGDVLTRDVGISYVPGAWRGELAGWRALVEHGDGLRPGEDRGYRALRRVLRHPASVRAFRWLHPDWSSPLARGTSKASRARSGHAEPTDDLRAVAASRLAEEHGLELVVFGHSHVATLERLGQRGVYANAGTWLTASTFLRVTPERIEMRRWHGSAEGDRLHAIDRGAQEALA